MGGLTGKGAAPAPPEEERAPEVHVHPTGAARQKAAAAREKGRDKPPREPAEKAPRSRAGGKAAPTRAGRKSNKSQPIGSRAALAAAVAALVVGLLVRAAGMGLLPFV